MNADEKRIKAWEEFSKRHPGNQTTMAAFMAGWEACYERTEAKHDLHNRQRNDLMFSMDKVPKKTFGEPVWPGSQPPEWPKDA